MRISELPRNFLKAQIKAYFKLVNLHCYAVLSYSASLVSCLWLAQGRNTDCLLMESAFCMKKVLMSKYASE